MSFQAATVSSTSYSGSHHWPASWAFHASQECSVPMLGDRLLQRFFCATLPAGILASSGAKNDYFMAMWLVAATYFALRLSSLYRWGDVLLLGRALGFALLTKATAYLFAPWLLGAILLGKPTQPRKRLIAGGLLAAAMALAISTPQYIRNYSLSGSIMGFDSAQGDGVFRWRNETFGWAQTASNILRNLSDQLGDRSNGWNKAVYKVVTGAHRELGIDINDPATTFRGNLYGPPVNANHEANVPNRWHLLMLVGVGCWLVWRCTRGLDLESGSPQTGRERPDYGLAGNRCCIGKQQHPSASGRNTLRSPSG
jgi:4-amino-4-deoxy-L-arabinose transferase-like glycosyltransferase